MIKNKILCLHINRNIINILFIKKYCYNITINDLCCHPCELSDSFTCLTLWLVPYFLPSPPNSHV